MPQKGLEKRVEFEEGKKNFPQKVFSPPQKTISIEIYSGSAANDLQQLVTAFFHIFFLFSFNDQTE